MFNVQRAFFGSILLVVIFSLLLPAAATGEMNDSQQDKTEKQKKIDRLFKMSLEELMDVRITTAGKTSQRIGDIPASVVLITREDIETYGYQSLREILINIPGLFAIDDYGDTGLNFGVRGFWSGITNDNMIILVNNVHQVNDILSNYPLNKIAVPVEAIDRIEIIRGPMSVVYGNGAFYGVINIITNQPTNKPVSMISASLGGSKTKKIFARASGKTGDFQYFFNASVFDTYGGDEALGDMMTDASVLSNFGLPEDSRTGGRLENKEKYFNFSGSFENFFVDVSYSEAEKEFYFALPSVADGSHDRINSTHFSFGYRKEFSKKVRLEGKVGYSRIRDSYKYDHLFEGFYGVEQLQSTAWDVDLNAFLKPLPKLDLTAGISYRTILDASDEYDLPSFGVPELENTEVTLAGDDNIVTRALFAQVDYSPSRKIKLIAGIRLEQSPKYELRKKRTLGSGVALDIGQTYNRDEIEFIPRLAVIYYLNEDNVFKFLYGEAINRPSFFQNTWNSLIEDYADLEPESIKTMELNYITTFSSRFSLNASLFRNTLNKLITRVVRFDEENNFESWFANADEEMVTHGIELSLNAEPIEYLRVELSGTYQETKDKRPGFENIDVAYSPKFLGYLKAFFLGVGFKVSVTGNYVGAMETYWDETILNPDNSFGARIGKKVSGYFLLGANLRIDDAFFDGLFLNIRCSNLLDKRFYYPTFTNNAWADRGTIGMGRSFLLSLGYKF